MQPLAWLTVLSGKLFDHRIRGVFAIEEVRYALYEPKGSITIVPHEIPSRPEPKLVRDGLAHAAAYSRGGSLRPRARRVLRMPAHDRDGDHGDG